MNLSHIKTLVLAGTFVGKDTPLLTKFTLEELKEKILHFFVWVQL